MDGTISRLDIKKHNVYELECIAMDTILNEVQIEKRASMTCMTVLRSKIYISLEYWGENKTTKKIAENFSLPPYTVLKVGEVNTSIL